MVLDNSLFKEYYRKHCYSVDNEKNTLTQKRVIEEEKEPFILEKKV